MNTLDHQVAAAIGVLLGNDLEHGSVFAARPEGPWCVPLRPACRAAGLAWPAERRRIEAHPILAGELREAVVSAGPGRSRRVPCLRVDFVAYWLATAEAAAVRDPERRERLLRFQQRCAHALAGGVAGRGGDDAR